ncbi:MAG TPA: CRISPR-associated endoribonuclease Cas6 [Ignavibacteria bacterium]|nr:CRISPR-associated endoribonuclease Cas6 [Ignavibacteria bacterium]
MRIEASFRSEKDVLLPVAHNHLVQALIYNHIDEKLANFLHDEGFVVGKRHFKLFTFSRLSGKVSFISKLKKFKIESPFGLVISSPVESFLPSLAENFLRKENLNLNGSKIFVDSINVHGTPSFDSEVEIKMLSPMTVYSTLETKDGRKKTYYYKPFEDEFSELIKQNLLKKYRAFYKQEPKDLNFSIAPIGITSKHRKIVDYKGLVIEGWMGKYKLEGNPELIKLGYDTGLGAKNSQGFGCFETAGKGNRNFGKVSI